MKMMRRSLSCSPPHSPPSDTGDIQFIRDFSTGPILGQGEFATVYHCKHRAPGGGDVAIKRYDRPFKTRSERESLLMEARYMDSLKQGGDHIVDFHYAWQESGRLYVCMELCERGSLGGLKDYLLSQDTLSSLPDSTLEVILHDTVAGLAHMHSHSLVHLDIKPSNILISLTGRLKLGDLGMATEEGERGDGREGDVRYMAPELLNSPARACSADLFSLGIMLLELGGGVEELPVDV